MRNLKLLRSLSSSELQAPGSPQHLSVRTDTGSLLVASHVSVTEFDPRTGQVVGEASLPAGDDGEGVVGLQMLAELEAACLATEGGDVLLFHLDTHQVGHVRQIQRRASLKSTGGSPQLECVGSVDGGLTAMSWSPDEELVVLMISPRIQSLGDTTRQSSTPRVPLTTDVLLPLRPPVDWELMLLSVPSLLHLRLISDENQVSS